MDPIDQPLRQNVGPLRDGGWRHPDGLGRRSDGPAEQIDSGLFVHGLHVSTLTAHDKPANLISWLNLGVVAPTLTERLRQVMDAMRWEHADVVRISGQSSSVVSQWLGKGSKTIKSINKMDAAMKLAEASGFAALWIAKGEGPQRAGGDQGDPRWPLAPFITPERWASLTDAQRAAVAWEASKALQQVEAAGVAPASGKRQRAAA